MAPKKRTASDMDDSDKDKKPSYSPIFPLFPEADLVIQSSDDVLFATRALYVRAVSSVFDGILRTLAKNGDMHDGHPVLKVDEPANLVELVLRYSHPGRLLLDGKAPELKWIDVASLMVMFDKYDTPLLARSVLSDQLPRFLGDPHSGARALDINARDVNVFAVATIWNLEAIARRALECHHTWGVPAPGCRYLSHRNKDDPNEAKDGWRSFGLGDVPIELLEKMSLQHIKQYSELHDKVAFTPGYSWVDASKDFKL